MSEPATASGFPRLTYLRIKNYRALRDVELRDLTPLTVFIGPNSSGKSTVLDALAFLAEAVSGNLQQAWEKRNRFAGMRTRGSDGPIEFEVKITDDFRGLTLRYILAIGEINQRPFIVNEELGNSKELLFISFYQAENNTTLASIPSMAETHEHQIFYNNQPAWRKTGEYQFDGWKESVVPLLTGLALPFAQELTVLKSTLTSYRYIHLTDDHLKGYSDAGPREKLSANGDNLPNVLYYLHTKHPEALARITAQLRRWVPGLADVVTEITSDERLLLRFRDAPFEKPLPAQYMSDGTMRLAALLTLLYEPNATGLLGLEEPENELHPRLLPRLAEELIKATETRQLLIATHSPALLDALEPEQVWILHRGEDGYTQATRIADIPEVVAMVEEGSKLGYLWARNFFDVGDPLAPRSSQSAQE
ncbi:AAA family ATPase [Hymenobacter sp. BT491]|uniref:AAA family ATPase n=1 Tax=Hymenobacter sp. BT491 TaxID=2766779 RepID=UPI001653E322|nr:AAA family ATPase [Hymenobacter sp. BT491]MBC6991026.1 AAA family ATPase [Hymenobacter sp. BT491]